MVTSAAGNGGDFRQVSYGISILHKKPAGTMSRRELAQNLLSGIAAGIFCPALSPLHPIHEHLRNAMLLDSSDEILASGNYRPAFLSPSQLSTLDTISEAIVPGSHKAQSAKFIDLLLSVDAAKTQQAFTDSLAALETAAGQTFHKNIVLLANGEVSELLKAASAKESGNQKHFENLKEWAVGAYYSSEIGMRELGWTPDRVFTSYPVCAHVESHS
jgi:Gluconate 2-dehydrogenase subunit 3